MQRTENFDFLNKRSEWGYSNSGFLSFCLNKGQAFMI